MSEKLAAHLLGAMHGLAQAHLEPMTQAEVVEVAGQDAGKLGVPSAAVDVEHWLQCVHVTFHGAPYPPRVPHTLDEVGDVADA